jgi:hypothetical protein
LVVAGCGGGWEMAGEFGRERGLEHLGERGKMKRNLKLKASGFGLVFSFSFFLKRLANPGWVNQPFCGQVPQEMLLK